MPELEVKEPTVKLEGVTVTKLDKGWGRFDAADGLWRNLIQSEAPSRAREEAMERAAVVRMAARQQVADLIKTTCGQVVPDLIVEIR